MRLSSGKACSSTTGVPSPYTVTGGAIGRGGPAGSGAGSSAAGSGTSSGADDSSLGWDMGGFSSGGGQGRSRGSAGGASRPSERRNSASQPAARQDVEVRDGDVGAVEAAEHPDAARVQPDLLVGLTQRGGDAIGVAQLDRAAGP